VEVIEHKNFDVIYEAPLFGNEIIMRIIFVDCVVASSVNGSIISGWMLA
jgi:hypothetical protein